MNREEIRDGALLLERMGYPIVLLEEGKKKLAFKNPHPFSRFEIQSWFRRMAFNVGVLLEPVKILVADIDGPEGEEWAAQLPETPMRVVTSKGDHRYFRHELAEVRSRIRFLGMPVDLKMTGHVVTWPSVNAETGHHYRMVNGIVRPEELPVFPAELLRERATERPRPLIVPASPSGGSRYVEAALRYEVQRVATAQEGTRNANLNRAAYSLGGLVAAGLLHREEVEAALTAAALAAGLGEQEIAATLNSGMTAGLKRPRKPN